MLRVLAAPGRIGCLSCGKKLVVPPFKSLESFECGYCGAFPFRAPNAVILLVPRPDESLSLDWHLQCMAADRRKAESDCDNPIIVERGN
jgi:hypothetical protein